MNPAVRWIAVCLPMAGFIAAATALLVMLFNAQAYRSHPRGFQAMPQLPAALAPASPEKTEIEGIGALDPFGFLDQRPIPVAPPEPEGVAHDLSLGLVAVTGSDRFCIIEGNILHEGQEIAGLRIKSITGNGVTVDTGEQSIFIRSGERIP